MLEIQIAYRFNNRNNQRFWEIHLRFPNFIFRTYKDKILMFIERLDKNSLNIVFNVILN